MIKVAGALLMYGLSLAACAEPVELNPMLVLSGSGTDIRRDLDPGRLSAIPSTQTRAAAVLDGSWEGVRFRYRVEHYRKRGQSGPSMFDEGRVSGRLMQLQKKFALSPHWALSAGKFNEKLDHGYYAQVLDFLNDNIVATDFEDLAARTNGFPMLKLSYSTGGLGGDLIYSDDRRASKDFTFDNPNPGFNRGLRQWIGVMRGNFEDISWNAVVQKPTDMKAGIGASFISTLNSQTQWYGALFSQRGSRIPTLRNIHPDGTLPLGSDDVYASNPYVNTRLHERRHRLRSMLGFGWTSEKLLGFRLEWLHDENGMSPREFDRWREIVQFHRHVSIRDRFASDVNLAWDAQALHSRQRDTFFIRIDRPFGKKFSAALGTIIGADRSVVLLSRVQYKPLGKAWDAWLDLQRSVGAAGTEFGSSPPRFHMKLGLRYQFE